MGELTGKVAVVTGATGVLCAAMCRELASAGAKVVVLARQEEKIVQLTQSIEASGGKALGMISTHWAQPHRPSEQPAKTMKQPASRP